MRKKAFINANPSENTQKIGASVVCCVHYLLSPEKHLSHL